MLKVVLLSLGGTSHSECLEGYGLYRSRVEIELAQGTTLTNEIACVATLVQLERASLYALHLQLCTLLEEVTHPEGHIAIVRCKIVETSTLVVHHRIRQVRGLECYPHGAVVEIVKLEFQRLHLLLLVGAVLLLGLLVGLLSFLEQSTVFLVHAELVVCLGIEEGDIHIAMRTPTAMTTVSGTVAGKYHCLATHHPTGMRVGISALCQVHRFVLTLGIYKSHIHVVPTAITHVVGQEPLAIGAPGEVLVAIGIGVVVLGIHGHPALARLEVNDADGLAVLQVCHLLAIGTIQRLETGGNAIGQSLLLYLGAIGHNLLLVVHHLRLVDAPYATTLAIVNHGTTIGTEVHTALTLWSLRYLLGGAEIHGGNIHISVQHESHILALGRNGNMCGTTAHESAYHLVCIDIGAYLHLHALRLSTGAHSVQLAIISEGQHTIIGDAEIAHGIALEAGDLL